MSETEIGAKRPYPSHYSKPYDYVKDELGLTDEEVEAMKKKGLVNAEQVLKDPTVGVHKTEHYNNGGFECRKVMEAIFTEPLSVEEGFYLGNAFKYLWRCQQKGSYLKDIAKVKEYCQFILDMHNV